MIPKHLLSAIVIVVSIVFAANFGAQFVIETYEPDPTITGVFGVIAGAAFALAQRQGRSDSDKTDDKPPDPPT